MKWIDSSKRLPDYHKIVLVNCPVGEYNIPYLAFWHKDNQWFEFNPTSGNPPLYHDVSHWAEITEPKHTDEQQEVQHEVD